MNWPRGVTKTGGVLFWTRSVGKYFHVFPPTQLIALLLGSPTTIMTMIRGEVIEISQSPI